MKSVGFFEEMNLYENNGSIKDFIVEEVHYNKEKVCEYLLNNKVVGICARHPIDIITGEEIASGFRIIVDGEYEWPDFLAYYVRKYNIKLPVKLIQKIDANCDMYGYYDGIPDDIKNMSLEELEKAIEEEKKKCDEMNNKD